jgi:hypothetical protein
MLAYSEWKGVNEWGRSTASQLNRDLVRHGEAYVFYSKVNGK